MKLKMSRLVGRTHSKNIKRSAFGVSFIILAFIAFNLAILLIYSSKTYPNTYVMGKQIGSVRYQNLTSVINSSHLLPKTITFSEGGHKFSETTASLGIKENVANIVNKLHSRSWLPVSNLLNRHTANLSLSVNESVLDNELNSIAAKYNKAATSAKISIGSGQFTLASDTQGYSLNTKLAANQIISALQNSKDYLVLPIDQTKPLVTTSGLKTDLNNLNDAASLSIVYSYNGKETKAKPSDIVNWYSLNGSSYSPSDTKIETFIKNAGESDGIAIANLASAVSMTMTALEKLTPLNFSLTALPNTPCTSNNLSELIIVSISKQHLWACSQQNEVYYSAVVTGDEQYADTLTPTGTYRIYAKQTNQTLIGHDENGSWNDFVNYWMPFLYNQYGAYGFHDATWRADSAFGNVDINTSNASNGCVELPLATAKWLYNWSYVGATVKIQN